MRLPGRDQERDCILLFEEKDAGRRFAGFAWFFRNLLPGGVY